MVDGTGHIVSFREVGVVELGAVAVAVAVAARADPL